MTDTAAEFCNKRNHVTVCCMITDIVTECCKKCKHVIERCTITVTATEWYTMCQSVTVWYRMSNTMCKSATVWCRMSNTATVYLLRVVRYVMQLLIVVWCITVLLCVAELQGVNGVAEFCIVCKGVRVPVLYHVWQRCTMSISVTVCCTRSDDSIVKCTVMVWLCYSVYDVIVCLRCIRFIYVWHYTIQIIARCQCNCTSNVLWCQVHSSHIHAKHKATN